MSVIRHIGCIAFRMFLLKHVVDTSNLISFACIMTALQWITLNVVVYFYSVISRNDIARNDTYLQGCPTQSSAICFPLWLIYASPATLDFLSCFAYHFPDGTFFSPFRGCYCCFNHQFLPYSYIIPQSIVHNKILSSTKGLPTLLPTDGAKKNKIPSRIAV
jgi:hypothetical protein